MSQQLGLGDSMKSEQEERVIRVIWVDFNRQNNEGAILLDLPKTLASLDSDLFEDEIVVITDDDAACIAKVIVDSTTQQILAKIIVTLV